MIEKVKIDPALLKTEKGKYLSAHHLKSGDRVETIHGQTGTVVFIKQQNYLPRFLVHLDTGRKKWYGKTKLRYKLAEVPDYDEDALYQRLISPTF